jgi:Escherichia/Staphylococcus phage prohead protease
MTDELERRTVEGGELRIESRGVAPLIRGYAVVFNRLSEPLGFFREQIAPEAVTRTLTEGIDLRALIDHNPEKPMGRLKSGTLRVEADAHGLLVEIDPPKTSYGHDIVESIRRGDVTGMSFAFRTLADTWNETADPPVRTVTDMLMREVSIVTFPAYPQTDVAMRSLATARQHSRWGRTVTERLHWAKAQQR